MKIIHAIIPIYVDNIGNAVEIYFNDITTTKYYSLDCCIKKIAKSELIDLTETRKIIKKTLNITKNPPICLKSGTYCMIKVRKTISKNDGSYGIFNIDSIKEIQSGKIILTNSKTITTLESKKNIEDKIQKARLSRLLIDDYTSKLDI
ncbi:MAG: hypothetical protein E6162_04015 [Finegoldia magna]|uniref:hypothetical protein n=1 Tax=Finegoldia magna TaxID=1260 RepID=UPI002909C822|nr:hypothetical protein [Finegoldia magna]MDU5272352.1 hypothetical protein [Finegoldia magna]